MVEYGWFSWGTRFDKWLRRLPKKKFSLWYSIIKIIHSLQIMERKSNSLQIMKRKLISSWGIFDSSILLQDILTIFLWKPFLKANTNTLPNTLQVVVPKSTTEKTYGGKINYSKSLLFTCLGFKDREKLRLFLINVFKNSSKKQFLRIVF